MRRAISLLMMVVVVLAPCAVAHAANSPSHQAGAPQMAAGAQHGHRHAVPDNLPPPHHVDCVSGDHGRDHNACSSDCDTLQRATSLSAVTHVELELKAAWPLMAVLLDVALRGLEAEPRIALGQIPADLRKDSKSVLRQTARLRL